MLVVARLQPVNECCCVAAALVHLSLLVPTRKVVHGGEACDLIAVCNGENETGRGEEEAEESRKRKRSREEQKKQRTRRRGSEPEKRRAAYRFAMMLCVSASSFAITTCTRVKNGQIVKNASYVSVGRCEVLGELVPMLHETRESKHGRQMWEC